MFIFSYLIQSSKKSRSVKSMLILILIVELFFGSLINVMCKTLPGSTPYQEEKRAEGTVLELDKPISREMKGGESQSFKIKLLNNQFIHLLVDQRGIDVVVTLYDENDQKIAEIDSPNGNQ